ncbi:MAG: YdcF family protein [Planctomycetota bacterium]
MQDDRPRNSSFARSEGPTRDGFRALLARTLSFFIGLFALANVARGLQSPGSDANLWWIDFRPLPAALGNLICIVVAWSLVIHAVRPRVRRADWFIVRASLGIIGIAALWNSLRFYELLADGTIDSSFPVPFSGLVFLATAAIWIEKPKSESSPWRLRQYVVSGTLAAFLVVAFPLAQMWCFGKTDYRRTGDAVVVFGAGVTPSGRPSLALSDRVLTACELYRERLAGTLILSGGPGPLPSSPHETDAMRQLAIDAGVDPGDILIDRGGVDTWSTVRNARTKIRKRGFRRVLAVSHFYHLPRIKMAFHRAGLEVLTVPAKESRTLIRLPFYVLREVAAFWYYYARPLAT